MFMSFIKLNMFAASEHWVINNNLINMKIVIITIIACVNKTQRS